MLIIVEEVELYVMEPLVGNRLNHTRDINHQKDGGIEGV